jgi:hypothetical protein
MTRQASLVVTAVVLGLWLVSFCLVLLSNRRGTPRAARGATELRPESPAVVSMLINGWEPAADLTEATLLDLAARGHIEFQSTGQGDGRATFKTSSRYPSGLTEYEQLIFDRAGSGSPGFRDETEAAAYRARLAKAVMGEAREAELWHWRFATPALAWLAGGAALAGLVTGVSMSWATGSAAATGTGILVTLTLVALVAAAQKIQHTAEGWVAAQHWLGVRAMLRGNPDAGSLPVYAVSNGDRWPAYGAALGVTHTISRSLELDRTDRARLWSPHDGWHRVRAHYPQGAQRFGRSTVDMFQRAGLVTGAGAVLLLGWWFAPGDLRDDSAWLDFAVNVLLVGGLGLSAFGLYLALRNALDLVFTKDITGYVLTRHPWRHGYDYLVVDDGRDDEVTAWAFPTGNGGPISGERARITVRPWTRRVIHTQVL